MKKIVIFICCILMVNSLTACGNKEVKENQVIEDVKVYEEFAALNVEVSEWEIFKRQTNLEDKLDYIYCTVKAQNEDYSVVRSYAMRYELYKEGWLLEDIEDYENPEAPTEIVPLRGVSEDQVIEDIKVYEEFAALNVEVSDWEIFKRQTNLENKVDYIYCTVKAQNEDYSVVRSYKMRYDFYNEGWLLEAIEDYENPEAPTQTVPLRGVSCDRVMADLAEINVGEYASGDNYINFEYTEEGLQSGAYMEVDEAGMCVYKIDATYEYLYWIEKALISLKYVFLIQDDGTFGWYFLPIDNEVERTAEIRETVIGKWKHESRSFMRSYEGEIEITSCEKDRCTASFYLIESGTYLFNDKKEIELKYDIYDFNNKIGNVWLILKEGYMSDHIISLRGDKENQLSVSGPNHLSKGAWIFERQ